MTTPRTNTLTRNIIIGMVLGLVVGGSLNAVGTEGMVGDYLVDGLFHVVGAIFIASLKLLVVPLVFVSLVCGTAALDDIRKLGRVGLKTMILYLATTAIAISLALMAAILVKPGTGFALTTDATQRRRAPTTRASTFPCWFTENGWRRDRLASARHSRTSGRAWRNSLTCREWIMVSVS